MPRGEYQRPASLHFCAQPMSKKISENEQEFYIHNADLLRERTPSYWACLYDDCVRHHWRGDSACVRGDVLSDRTDDMGRRSSGRRKPVARPRSNMQMRSAEFSQLWKRWEFRTTISSAPGRAHKKGIRNSSGDPRQRIYLQSQVHGSVLRFRRTLVRRRAKPAILADCGRSQRRA